MTDRRGLRRRFHPEFAFGGFTDIDGTLAFYARVQECLPTHGVVIDVGCGRGVQAEDPVRVRRTLADLRGPGRHVVGLDLDPAGSVNPQIDEFRQLRPGAAWPVDEASVDLALADFVVEHVENPDGFFGEAARVLAPDGVLCLRTVNARSYLGLVSRAVPVGRTRLLGRAHGARAAEDVFPTHYRCNTRGRLAATLDRQGFDAVVYGFEAEPDYLTFSPWAYRIGLLHRRLAPAALRVGLVAFARRR